MLKLSLIPENNQRLQTLCGENNKHIEQIEQYLNIEISHRGHSFVMRGNKEQTAKAKKLIQDIYKQTATQKYITDIKIHILLQSAKINDSDITRNTINIRTKKIMVTPNSQNQINYIENILKHDICFGIGPAGTGKTFLAVASAVAALEKKQIHRIILVRPAVEAGERLGFLLGSISEKIDPYLRPLYDALYETIGTELVEKLISDNIIEIAPLAFMRGRTLNSSFVILDESQNTTIEQMKMFLTRIGFGSKAVITGDITQIDLQKNQQSGLTHAIKILQDESGISFNFFKSHDVVRHPLVQRIIEAYTKKETDEYDNPSKN